MYFATPKNRRPRERASTSLREDRASVRAHGPRTRNVGKSAQLTFPSLRLSRVGVIPSYIRFPMSAARSTKMIS